LTYINDTCPINFEKSSGLDEQIFEVNGANGFR